MLKKELHQLVDRLPEKNMARAEKYLERLVRAQPRSVAMPRPHNKPLYIAPTCSKCNTPLVIADLLNNPNVPQQNIWHDEFICPICRDYIYLDWPESEKSILKKLNCLIVSKLEDADALFADLIKTTLSLEEKEEFLFELFPLVVQVVKTGGEKHIDALRQLLIAWEYTAMIKSDKEFVRELGEIEKEIKNDPVPGVAWREVLRGQDGFVQDSAS